MKVEPSADGSPFASCPQMPVHREYEDLDSSVHKNLNRTWSTDDYVFMEQALALAREAAAGGEVPVGAVIVSERTVMGRGFNRPISSADPTAHAEIEALRAAAAAVQDYRLPGTTLYVTIEPCAMCAGAIVHARVERLVFGARDIRFGAVRSKFQLADSPLLNHRVQVQEGLLAAEAADLLTAFFQSRRGGS